MLELVYLNAINLENYLQTMIKKAKLLKDALKGEFFKEIDLSEKKSTGISKILRELKTNGSPLPEFETDADRGAVGQN